MATEIHTSPVAVTYARSLLELANEQKQAEAIGLELGELRTILEGNDTFRAVLADPGINVAERRELLDKVFKGRVSPLMLNFLGVLNAHGRLRLLDQIATSYDDQLNDLVGKIEVDVTAAEKLTPEEVETIRQRLSQSLGKDVVLHVYVDDSILGGLVIRVQDRVIDASTKYQLKAIREQLLAARPK
jgi:F-type H+-transporting ATPase subunit delta